jgi:hypothetical protein
MQTETSEQAPEPSCKAILALLTPEPAWEPDRVEALAEAFGEVDYRGPFFPFDGGGYYDAEMGGPLHRGLLSFRGLRSPRDLVEWKHRARALEARWSLGGKRSRNLDVGYLDADKVVLASFKPGPRKLYLERGVWADMVLGYSGGKFIPTPWAFPDFKSGRYDRSLGVMREKLKAEMRR